MALVTVPGFHMLMICHRKASRWLHACRPLPQRQAAVLHLAPGIMPIVSTAQARKYAFKCHRKLEDGKDIVYPVNTMSFHPSHGTFATGGG